MPKLWSKDDCETSARIWEQNRDMLKWQVCELIGKIIGRTPLSVNQRLHYFGPDFNGPPRPTRRMQRAQYRMSIASGVKFLHSRPIPQDVFETRDAREVGYRRRDLTAAMCGDPPVGYSALDEPPTLQRVVGSHY